MKKIEGIVTNYYEEKDYARFLFLIYEVDPILGSERPSNRQLGKDLIKDN